MSEHEVELLVKVTVKVPDPTVRGSHDNATLNERAAEYGFESAVQAAAIQLVQSGRDLGGSDGWADFPRDVIDAYITWVEEA